MDKPAVSFEFFPPKTDRARELLWEAVGMLSTLNPKFMTVTYGAGGSTRDWTVETATHIQGDTGVPTAAHLTCIGNPKAEVDALAGQLWDKGIRHIIALRGDAPKDKPVPRPDDPAYYGYADALVKGLLRLHPFEISVAAYPEKHPEAPDLETDIEHLKRKCDAGAVRAITQFFFDNERYLRFVDKCRAAGITVPIVAGILPIANHEKAFSFAEKCGTYVPREVREKFFKVEPDSETARMIAAIVLVEQVEDLLERGVQDFHFYTLNQSQLTYTACRHLGLVS